MDNWYKIVTIRYTPWNWTSTKSFSNIFRILFILLYLHLRDFIKMYDFIILFQKRIQIIIRTLNMIVFIESFFLLFCFVLSFSFLYLRLFFFFFFFSFIFFSWYYSLTFCRFILIAGETWDQHPLYIYSPCLCNFIREKSLKNGKK